MAHGAGIQASSVSTSDGRTGIMRSLCSLPTGTRSQCVTAPEVASWAAITQPVSSRLSSPACSPHSRSAARIACVRSNGSGRRCSRTRSVVRLLAVSTKRCHSASGMKRGSS